MIVFPFGPMLGRNATLACTATETTAAFPGNVSGAQGRVYRVVNAGPNIAFVRISRATDTTAASATDTPVLPGTEVKLHTGFAGEAILARAICAAAGTATVYVQPGNGGI